MTDARDATTIDSTLSAAEMRELVLEAWRMVVPKGVAEDFDLGVPDE